MERNRTVPSNAEERKQAVGEMKLFVSGWNCFYCPFDSKTHDLFTTTRPLNSLALDSSPLSIRFGRRIFFGSTPFYILWIWSSYQRSCFSWSEGFVQPNSKYFTNPSTATNISPFHMSIHETIHSNEKLIDERSTEINKLAQGVTEVNSLMKEVQHLVAQQRPIIGLSNSFPIWIYLLLPSYSLFEFLFSFLF